MIGILYQAEVYIPRSVMKSSRRAICNDLVIYLCTIPCCYCEKSLHASSGSFDFSLIVYLS